MEEHSTRHLPVGDPDGGDGADERGLGGDDMRDIDTIPYLEGWRDGVLAFNGNVPTKVMRPVNEQIDYLEGFKDAVQFMKEGE